MKRFGVVLKVLAPESQYLADGEINLWDELKCTTPMINPSKLIPLWENRITRGASYLNETLYYHHAPAQLKVPPRPWAVDLLLSVTLLFLPVMIEPE